MRQHPISTLKSAFLLLAVLLLGVSTVAAASSTATFNGSFAQISVRGGGVCEEVFATEDYELRHTWFGSGGRTSVVRLISQQGDGFFDRVTLVGRNGYSNDIYIQKSLDVRGVPWRLTIEGIVDANLVLVTVTATHVTAAGEAVCSAQAEYSGFQ